MDFNNEMITMFFATIIRNEIYIVTQNTCNVISYKNNKHRKICKEKRIKVQDVHDLLVSKEDFEWIQDRLFTKIICAKKHSNSLFS